MTHAFYKPKKKKERKVLDKLIYPIGLISPIMTIPQLIQVWNGHAQGVSVLTWGSFGIVSFFWILYGLHHNEKPIFLINTLLFILNVSIVYGILFR